ncbi:MAG TPA: metalloregulator ArsR/SmtB family transcription factor [Myxococcota bacterium]
MRNRDVFVGLADPTRREILDLLRAAGPLNAGGIASRFGAVTRPGISRHLRVLRECGLVEAEGQGRENLYRLDARPILRARDGWLARFGSAHAAQLKALRRRAER